MSAPASEICFITPTFRGDFHRFRLLRETLVRSGQGHVPHYALIDTEDLPLVEKAALPNVYPITTAQALGPEIETRRIAYNRSGGRVWKRWQRSINKRTGLFPDSRFYGWQIQQLLKLAVPTQLPHRVFVSFDSDLIACGCFGPEDFIQSGKTVLYASCALLSQPGTHAIWRGWYSNACLLFGLTPPMHPHDESCDHVAQPFVFEQNTMRAMHAWLERRYGQPWWKAITDQPLAAWSEFMTYGVFVRRVLQSKDVFIRNGREQSLWIEYEQDYRNADALIRKAFEDPAIKFLCLQADDHQRWQLEKFEPLLREYLSKPVS